jgi:hypothetical protein
MNILSPEKTSILINSLCDPLLWRISHLDPESSYRTVLIEALRTLTDFEEAFIAQSLLRKLKPSKDDECILQVCSDLSNRLPQSRPKILDVNNERVLE